MQRGQILVYILVGVLILVSVAGGAYYLGKASNRSPVQNPVITSQAPQSTPSPVNETVNWKTYKDTASTLSMKYPSNWNLVEGPKQVQDKIYDYEYLKLTGKEGEITIMHANQLGGGTLDLFATAYKPDLENRNAIIKIISSIDF